MKKAEVAAVILGATLILAPLYAGETQNFVGANRQPSGGQTPNPTEILAWLGFGVLLFQAWIAFRQTGISREQNGILAKQTLIQTETSRPHIFIVGISLEKEGGGWFTLGTIWENSGLTPPIGFNTFMAIEHVRGTDLPENYNYAPRQYTSDVPLGIKREIIVDRIMIQENTLIDDFHNGWSWFVWGKANYTDGFSPGIVHRVDFCFRMFMQNGTPTFTQWGDHNRTYDEKI